MLRLKDMDWIWRSFRETFALIRDTLPPTLSNLPILVGLPGCVGRTESHSKR
jgi:hypothetical protein